MKVKIKAQTLEAYRVGDEEKPEWLQSLFDAGKITGVDVIEMPTRWGYVDRAEPGDFIVLDDEGNPVVLSAEAGALLFK